MTTTYVTISEHAVREDVLTAARSATYRALKALDLEYGYPVHIIWFRPLSKAEAEDRRPDWKSGLGRTFTAVDDLRGCTRAYDGLLREQVRRVLLKSAGLIG